MSPTTRRLLGASFAASLLFGAACGDDPAAGDGVPGQTGGAELPPTEDEADRRTGDEPATQQTTPQAGHPEGAPTPDPDTPPGGETGP